MANFLLAYRGGDAGRYGEDERAGAREDIFGDLPDLASVIGFARSSTSRSSR